MTTAQILPVPFWDETVDFWDKDAKDEIKKTILEFLEFGDSIRLSYDRIYLILCPEGITDKIMQIVDENDLLRELNGIGKVTVEVIGERRQNDFMLSFLYNLFKINPRSPSLEENLEALKTGAGIDKGEKRKIDYYTSKIGEFIEKQKKERTASYLENMEEMFPLRGDEDILRKVRDRIIQRPGMSERDLDYILLASACNSDDIIKKNIKNSFKLIRGSLERDIKIKGYTEYSTNVYSTKQSSFHQTFLETMRVLGRIDNDQMKRFASIFADNTSLTELLGKSRETELETMFKGRYLENVDPIKLFLKAMVASQFLERNKGKLKLRDKFTDEVKKCVRVVKRMENTRDRIKVMESRIGKSLAYDDVQTQKIMDLIDYLKEIKKIGSSNFLVFYLFGYSEGRDSILGGIIAALEDRIAKIESNLKTIETEIVDHIDKFLSEKNYDLESITGFFEELENSRIDLQLPDQKKFSREFDDAMSKRIDELRHQIGEIKIDQPNIDGDIAEFKDSLSSLEDDTSRLREDYVEGLESLTDKARKIDEKVTALGGKIRNIEKKVT